MTLCSYGKVVFPDGNEDVEECNTITDVVGGVNESGDMVPELCEEHQGVMEGDITWFEEYDKMEREAEIRRHKVARERERKQKQPRINLSYEQEDGPDMKTHIRLDDDVVESLKNKSITEVARERFDDVKRVKSVDFEAPMWERLR